MANDNVPPQILRNFDELASPPPAKTNKDRLWLGYSADNLRSKPKKKSGDLGSNGDAYNEPDDYSNLDEVAAPSPIDEDAEKGEPHLEDQRNGSSALPSHQRSPHASRLETELYTIAHLILFSILGTLSRLGLQALTNYPGAPVQTPVLWANVAGSFILGFLSEDQRLFRPPASASDTQSKSGHDRNQHNAHKKTIPLYIGLAIGYCGSFTSFSSFTRDAFYALANALPVAIQHPSLASPPSSISTNLNVHRNGGYSFLALLAIIISTVGLSLTALQVGAQLALGLENHTPSLSHLVVGRRKVVDRLSVFLAAGVWLAAIIMSILPPDRHHNRRETWRSQALFALVFAPLGCLLRFYASLHLNGRIPSFPLGTFAVNVAGSALLAMFVALQHAPVGALGGCQVLQGMDDGFCGCLTTVSTWVSELKGLRRRHAWVYGAWSVGVGVCLFIVICGSLMWKQGFKPALCMA